MPSGPFDDERLRGARSALVKVTPDTQGRFTYELWCQYTRRGLDALQVGDLVAVENYTPPEGGRRVYSILTLAQVYPVHFAAQGGDAYPGHVFESMRSIKDDWERQSDRPLHLTTTITALAVSTGWQFRYEPRDTSLPSLEEEENIPMTGSELRPLSRTMVDAIINQGVREQPDSPFTHKKFEDLNVKLDTEGLLTTHFGIFGFTNVGKSNLVSSLISALASRGVGRMTNVVIMDPNDEYLGLLVDKFVSSPQEISYLQVGGDSLALPIIQSLGQNAVNAPQGVVNLMRAQLRLPARLAVRRDLDDFLLRGLRNALGRTRIALMYENLATMIRGMLEEQTPEQAGPPARDALRAAGNAWANQFTNVAVDAGTIQRALDLYDSVPSAVLAPLQNLAPGPQGTVQGALRRTREALVREQQVLRVIPAGAILPLGDLVRMLNDPNRRQAVIVTGRRDTDLKRFGAVLGNALYESRRQMASRDPFTTFIFDEADLFLPLDSGDERTAAIKEFCVTLARRGRKFGLGIGIATQRASLLDTEVMANLHTYFVSKLPRANDRQRVAEAFGIGEEQLAATFTFRPGNWLLISHDATGLRGVPIPTSALDANRRIIEAAGLAA